MPLWFSLAMHGTDKYVAAIERGLELAQIASEKIKNTDYLELVRKPGLSTVLFQRKNWEAEDYRNWTYRNQEKGFALVTPTQWTKNNKTEPVARFCFINPDTTEKDIQDILDTMTA